MSVPLIVIVIVSMAMLLIMIVMVPRKQGCGASDQSGKTEFEE
jgi:preprotein translocase subunit SecG